MSRIVVLDSGPLGLVTSPGGSERALRCQAWIIGLGHRNRVVLPEIADHEVRCELIRARKSAGLQRLDQLKTTVEYQPITTEAMLLAAELWAAARQQGRPTSHDTALDGDVILAAQARLLADESDDVIIVATDNVGHLSRFISAAAWEEIPPG